MGNCGGENLLTEVIKMKPVCIITGAGGLLGRALCAELIKDFNIVAAYRKTIPAVASQMLDRLNPGSTPTVNTVSQNQVYSIQADLTKRDDIQRLTEVTMAKYGQIDVLINSAADTKFHGKLKEMWQADEEFSLNQLRTNCIAPMQLVSAIYDACWKNNPGENLKGNRCVINVSSMSAINTVADVGQGFYGASKAALNVLSSFLSLELAPYSVRVNAICPGRFKDQLSTAHVVNHIKKLITSNDNNRILTGF